MDLKQEMLSTYKRQRFIKQMNRKWQKKYEDEQAWFRELEQDNPLNAI